MSIRGSLRAVMLLSFIAAASSSQATINHPGKWSTPVRWRKSGSTDLLSETAVNMLLLARPDSLGQTRARVLWWQDDHDHDADAPPDTSFGGFLEWRPGNDADLNSGAFPDTTIATGTLVPFRYPSPGYNIFCSGMGFLEEDQGFGRVLIAGGTVEAENGSPLGSVYNARTNAWTRVSNEMGEGRWYPTVTTLADGKSLVTSGSRYREMWLFGGGASSDSTLYRDPVSSDQAIAWNQSVLPDQDASTQAAPPRPIPRRGHTATWEIGGTQAYYGGQRLDDGQILSDLWLLRKGDNLDQPGYRFNWESRTPLTGSGPGKRAYHAAAVLNPGNSPLKQETLLLVGGQTAGSGPGATSAQVWAGRLIWNTWKISWSQLFSTNDSETFPARHGHASVWEPRLRRLFVYGGSAEPGQLPSDPDVYALEFVGTDVDSVMDSTLVRWTKCTVQHPDTVPLPRAFMAAGAIERTLKLTSTANRVTRGLVVYGGRTSANVVSDSLYVLWPIDSVTVRWQKVPQTGTHPALEYASGTANENFQEFWVLGGRNGSGTAQSAAMSTELAFYPTKLDTARWQSQAAAGQAVWGHTFPAMGVEVFARTSELYDPASNSFTPVSDAYRKEDWYPQTFTIPGQPGQVFVTGPQSDAWKLSLSGTSGTWNTVSGTSSGFRGGSSVTYRPGKILKCGSRDTDGIGTAIGTTKVIDITAGSPTWTASGSMVPRVNHNLVVLPNGKVLVVGGMGYVSNQDNVTPRRRPEIWDPDANSGAGAWEGGDGNGTQLDSSLVARGYHSTALLLPDGRVLCAGGNATDGAVAVGQPWQYDQWKTDLYSPPYLFNVNGTPATRPEIRWSPRRVSYGQTFIVGVDGSTTVASMCLVRPGAVTHGYDESQRYVALSYSATAVDSTANRYYKVAAPTDSSVAPPGDYLLFVLNTGGTPAIARWVRVSRTNSSTGAPTTVADLRKQCSDGTSVTLLWAPPGTDAGDPVPAPAKAYDIRYKTSAMNDWSSFQAGSAATPPAPGDPTVNTADNVTISGLTLNQTYYFRLAAKSYASGSGNWSALSNQISFLIHDEECGGSGGGGGGGGYEEGASIRPGATLNAARPTRPGGPAPDSTFLENTLLPNVASGTTKTDRIRLPFGPRWTETGARVRLSRAGTRSTHFDRVRLLAADYAESEGVFLRGGEPVGGITHDPARVMHADGRDLTDTFLSGGVFDGRDGDTLYVETGEEGAGSIVLSTSRAQLVRAPDRTGIDLACEGLQGWVAIGHHEVREHTSDEVFDTPSLHRVRLVFHGVHRLEWVGGFTPGPAVVTTAYDPVAADHSRLGDVEAGLSGDGATLASGDQMLVDFAATPPAPGALRQWFLEVTGAHMEGGGGVQMAKLAGQAEAAPLAFALARNRPNPFAGTTTIGFDVPRRTHVRLEVFDVLGRRVATLADREYEPGCFSLAWDGRTSAGTVARAGVYLCRMSAGSFRSQQHLVLIH